MAIDIKHDEQPLDINRSYKISGIDIELQEKQFMNNEFESYKEAKIKSKKNAHAEGKKTRFFL